MAAETESRIRRWSRLKQEQEQAAVAEAPASAATEGHAQAPDEVPVPDEVPELPDIETLDGDSDFSVFMGEKVPEELQRLALRKLWLSDPVYANLDGLNDYDPGFTTFLEQISEVAEEKLRDALNSQETSDADGAADKQAPAADGDPEVGAETAGGAGEVPAEPVREAASDDAAVAAAPEAGEAPTPKA